jgi:hypothetical protein
MSVHYQPITTNKLKDGMNDILDQDRPAPKHRDTCNCRCCTCCMYQFLPGYPICLELRYQKSMCHGIPCLTILDLCTAFALPLWICYYNKEENYATDCKACCQAVCCTACTMAQIDDEITAAGKVKNRP